VSAPAELSLQQKERYERQLRIPEFGEPGQLLLLRARVLVAGAGGIGGASALYMAAAGVGSLRIADHDEVTRSDLNRQILYTNRHLGQTKVALAREHLLELTPGIEVEAVDQLVTRENVDAIAEGCDLVVDGLDNQAARDVLNDYAIRSGKPLIYGAVSGFLGHMSLIEFPHTPCLRCFRPASPTPPEAPIIGAVAGMMGALQALEAIKRLTGVGDCLRGRLLVFNALDMTFEVVSVKVDPECRACGGRR
jgi:sulfur-carrier protein adenylyltransferase/sulfurtransferase